MHCTIKAHADRDEQGRYLVRGSGGPFYFMGDASDTGEAVVTDDTEIRVNGEWRALVPLLSGGVCVLVL
jgi:hypothetical protein